MLYKLPKDIFVKWKWLKMLNNLPVASITKFSIQNSNTKTTWLRVVIFNYEENVGFSCIICKNDKNEWKLFSSNGRVFMSNAFTFPTRRWWGHFNAGHVCCNENDSIDRKCHSSLHKSQMNTKAQLQIKWNFFEIICIIEFLS